MGDTPLAVTQEDFLVYVYFEIQKVCKKTLVPTLMVDFIFVEKAKKKKKQKKNKF